jgi:competence protein ComEC
VIAVLTRVRRPHALLLALCTGIAAANVARVPWIGLAGVACAVAAGAAFSEGETRVAALVTALALAGWWWGSVRLDALDHSVLLSQVERAERSRLVVTGPPRRGRFELRLPARVLSFGRLDVSEPVLLELPLGRAPPQGALIEALGQITLPRGPEHGFDERTWLRRHGVHVIFHGDRWRMIGRRGGLGGIADRVRERVGRTVAGRLHGERRAVLLGVLLGDDTGLSEELRVKFRASGLYHLLAVSGQNVALVAGFVLGLVWLLGIPRWLGELGALVGMAAYVLAVGAQPSVLRAGVAGALGSLAWLTARQRDRWYFLLLGAVVLLAWNPYVVFDAGFQLSFAAVIAIFTTVAPLQRALGGYPIPPRLAGVVAVSAACGTATAPIAWLQFHAVPLLTVPANALAAPVVIPLLLLGLATVALAPIAPGGAELLAWLNGWCAAYLAGCAKLVGNLPGAQIRSGRAAAGAAGCALLGGAYAWRRWRRTSSRST